MQLIMPTAAEVQIKKGITPFDIHVNRPLTNMSVAWMQDQSMFISDRIFPKIPVQKQSDLYYQYNRSDWNRNEMAKRAPSTETKGTSYNVSTEAYFTHVYGLHRDVDDQLRANADDPLNLDVEASNLLSQRALIFREVEWTNNFFAPGVWTNQELGVAAGPVAGQFLQWDQAAAEPVKDVKRWKDGMLLATGFMPNVMVMGHKVYTELTENPSIIDRIKYGQTPGAPAQVTRQALAALFEIDRIEVMSAIVNTNKETQKGGPDSNAFIGGNHVGLYYAAPAPGIMTPSAGYTFVWAGYAGAGEFGQRLSSFRMDNIRSDRVEIEMAFDHKMVSDDMGFMAVDAVA